MRRAQSYAVGGLWRTSRRIFTWVTKAPQDLSRGMARPGVQLPTAMPGATNGILILDIETVPDLEIYLPPEPPAGNERPFPPLYACRPIVLGVIWLDEAYGCKRIGIIGEDKSEADMMEDFADFMTKYRPLVVTWNGRQFDLPILALRALRHGVGSAWYYRGNGHRYRFSEDGHLDVADVLSDFGAARMTSLDGAAKLIGLPGKLGVDGSQVEGLFRDGQLAALRAYCLSDVAQTTFVFLRYRLVSGEIDLQTYQRAARELLGAMEADGRFSALLSGVDRERLLLASRQPPPTPTPSTSTSTSGDVPA